MFLVFDTETNGLPNKFNSSIFTTSNYPYIMQLSYIIYDNINNTFIKKNFYINNVEVKEESFQINKISKEMIENGNNILDVLNEFILDIQKCDIIIAHNLNFDKKMVMVECIRNNIFSKFYHVIKNKKEYCTMKNTVNFCKINFYTKNKLNNSYKYPKLIELYEKLFDEKLDNINLHNSLIDCVYTLKCYYKYVYNEDIFKKNLNIKNLI